MRSQQKIVTLLLCSVMIAALLSIPSAISQEFTTTTTTTLSTLTEPVLTSTYAYQTTTVPVMTTQGSSQTLSLIGSQGNVRCYASVMSFNASSSGMIHIDYSTNEPTNLWLLNVWDFVVLGGPAGLSNTPATVLCSKPMFRHADYYVTSSLSDDWSLDPTQNPYFLVMVANATLSQPPQVQWRIGPLDTGTSTATTIVVTHAFAATTTETLTSSSMITIEIPFLQTSTGISTVAGAVIGGIVVLFAVVYVLTKRKRREPEPSKVAETAPTEQEVPPIEPEAPTEMEVPEQKPPTEQFCINCGSKLPTGSKFCNNCGTKQP